jgi:2-pyrone-4,6-dicarboxylate lactonase
MADPLTLDDRTLANLHARGVRGVRINPGGLVRDVAHVAATFNSLVDRLHGTAWHIEINALPPMAEAFANALKERRVKLVFDHLFGLDPSAPTFVADSRRILALVARTEIWVKYSGLDRDCSVENHRQKMTQFLARLFELMPTRIVWGSDWPHTPLHGDGPHDRLRKVDSRREALAALSVAAEHADDLYERNPIALYDGPG